MSRSIIFGLAVLLSASTVLAQGAPFDNTALYQRFDAQLSSSDQLKWLKPLASEPNQVGSPHDKANADWILAQFQKFGWEAHIETFEVLYPTPIDEGVEMDHFKATLQERPISGDTSATAKDYALPAYLAYQGDGDVNAPLIYVNYGTEADYKQLAQMGISVEGKIVLARYGQVWRGVKPLLAYRHGAIGCIIYSDPADDGYSQDAVYPKGPMRPPQGIQRGSAMDMMLYPGDPLTPGIGATSNAKRLTHETAPTVLKIPALPISYADAQVLLLAMGGPVAPRNWRGSLPVTYRIGPGTRKVHLKVRSDWSLKPVYDVIATVKGSTWPDQWVIRGNHHDGWVEGGNDPLSGQVALLDEARAIGGLLKTGWRPKRSIVYTSWDGEEPMLLGSTEWAEEHDQELKAKAVIYINTDDNSRGFMHVAGNQDLGEFITQVAEGVIDPEANVSVSARARAKLLTDAAQPNAGPEIKAQAKDISDPSSNIPVDPLGSGSDFSPFIDHLGVPTLSVVFGGEAKGGGAYHSRYDTFEYQTKFIDPHLVYGKVMAELVGHAVLHAADADLPLQEPIDFSKAVARYVTDVKKLADSRREAAEQQKTLLANHMFALAADPTEPHGDPMPLRLVPQFDFAPLDGAVASLEKSSKAYDAAFMPNVRKLSPKQLADLHELMNGIDGALLSEGGLPGRPWYKNLIYAPGRYIGYGVTTLPGVTEAITEERWDDVPTYVGLTAGAINAYSAKLQAATAILDSAGAQTSQ